MQVGNKQAGEMAGTFSEEKTIAQGTGGNGPLFILQG